MVRAVHVSVVGVCLFLDVRSPKLGTLHACVYSTCMEGVCGGGHARFGSKHASWDCFNLLVVICMVFGTAGRNVSFGWF